jgi:hypothetical protein
VSAINHRTTAERLLREILDETIMDREDAKRMLTAALCDAYDAGRVLERERIRGQVLQSAGLR